jgi:hypothetical protein
VCGPLERIAHPELTAELITEAMPGGWRDPWDEPDDAAKLRADGQAIVCRQLSRTAVIGRCWQREIRDERKRPRRGGHQPGPRPAAAGTTADNDRAAKRAAAHRGNDG